MPGVPHRAGIWGLNILTLLSIKKADVIEPEYEISYENSLDCENADRSLIWPNIEF
jgi:hypothetical protein